MTTVQPRPPHASNSLTRPHLNATAQGVDRTREQNFKQLPRTSLPTFSQLIAVTAGLAFTFASAATNLTYGLAKSPDPVQQIIWGSVAVAASLVLAVAPSAFINSVQSRQVGSACAGLLACLVFGAFSIAGALGSATGGRVVAGLDATDATDKRTVALATIETKTAQLKALAPTKTLAELDAELTRLKGSRRDLNDCVGYQPNNEARRVCVQISEVLAEDGRANHREALEHAITDARKTLGTTAGRSTVANTDALALQGFATALGVQVSTDTLNKMLVLLAVLVIELGGGLSFAVAGALGRSGAECSQAKYAKIVSEPLAEVKPQTTTTPTPQLGPITPEIATGAQGMTTEPHVARSRLLSLVLDSGGSVRGSHKSLGISLGISAARVGQLISELKDDGRVVVRSSATGTVISLVGASSVGAQAVTA